MKIAVKRTGGYAGLSEDVAATDTEKISKKAASQVQRIVQKMGFFNLPDKVTGSSVGADLFYYEITVTDGNRQHTVGFYLDDDPETSSLRQLVDTVVKLPLSRR